MFRKQAAPNFCRNLCFWRMSGHAQRLAQQRLQRSQDRLRSSQTSSSSYGSWFTPDPNPPPRRQLTSPSKNAPAQRQQPPPPAQQEAPPPPPVQPELDHGQHVRGSISVSAGQARAIDETNNKAIASCVGGGMRGSINLDYQGDVPESRSSAQPPPGAGAPVMSNGVTMVGSPEVPETTSPAYAVHSKVCAPTHPHPAPSPSPRAERASC